MSGKTVLITGISGFVATHVALAFLSHGWKVRGTVRSADKVKDVADLPIFKPYADHLSFVVVEDLVSGSFDEAIQGVDAVAHTASPFNYAGRSWESYEKPAVQGTVNVLRAAKAESSVKNVVVTSSFAAIDNPAVPPLQQKGKVYTEDDWNPVTQEDCKKLKVDDPGAAGVWYCASKKFAEKAAFEEAKGANFTLATICPPMVFGPPVHSIKSLDSLNASAAGVYGLMKKDGTSVNDGIPETHFPVFADVRNVAEAHYEAVARNKSGRFLICSGFFDNQLMAKCIRESFPQIKDRVPEPVESESLEGKVFTLSAAKAEKELGIKFIPFDKCIHDTVERFLELEKVLA